MKRLKRDGSKDIGAKDLGAKDLRGKRPEKKDISTSPRTFGYCTYQVTVATMNIYDMCVFCLLINKTCMNPSF